MEENKNIDKGIKSRRDKFKKDPSVDAWKRLDADLERQRAMIYRDRGNRFKMLSIGLALVLVAVLAYFYFTPNPTKVITDSTKIKAPEKVENTGNSTNSNGGEQSPSSSIANTPPANEPTKQEVTTPSNSIAKSVEKPTHVINKYEDKPVSISNTKDNSIVYDVSQVTNDIKENATSSTEITNEPKAPPADDKTVPEPTVNSNDSGTIKTMKDSILANEKGKVSHWTLSAFYGPNIVAENRLKILQQQYANVINSYETLSTENYSFNSGLLMGYNISKKFSVSTGVIYSTIAYSSTYPTLHTRIGEDNLYHYRYVTSCGTLEIPNDDNVVLSKTDSLKSPASCSQIIGILSIPILFKYQFTHNRFSFYATAGLMVNIIINETANVTIDNNKYTISNNIIGLNKTNYSYMIGAGLDYTLNSDMSVFIEPSFRNSITSLTQNNFFNCYPYSFGMNLGLTLHF